jgi:hypothetical protein
MLTPATANRNPFNATLILHVHLDLAVTSRQQIHASDVPDAEAAR